MALTKPRLTYVIELQNKQLFNNSSSTAEDLENFLDLFWFARVDCFLNFDPFQAEAGVDYEDHRVEKIDDLKASGKLAFGQVPFWEEPVCFLAN
jgi:hypothetical protein